MLSARNLHSMQKISPCRNSRLFSEFLPKGYKLTTLDSVTKKDEVVHLKIILGTLITLFDDFADVPDRFNPRLLEILYQIPFAPAKIHKAFLSCEEQESTNLCEELFQKLFNGMENLPNYRALIKIFQFDLKQFFLANQYSELVTSSPDLSNPSENRLYLHHNMGIVMAGMIDLMSLDRFHFNELGMSRSLFLFGQRAGRISNVLTTFEREMKDGDFTNEILSDRYLNDPQLAVDHLESELSQTYKAMEKFENIQSFSTKKYREGIENLHHLHLKLKGVI